MNDGNWQKLFDELVLIAKKKMGGMPLHIKSEEDIAASAMKSYFNGVGNGRFQLPADGFSLRPLLSVIVARKVADLAAYLRAQKRDISRLTGAEVDAIVGPEISPSSLLAHDEERRLLLDGLRNDQLRQIAEWKTEGYTNREIARRLGCVERSVERGIRKIREIWTAFVSERWQESMEAVRGSTSEVA